MAIVVQPAVSILLISAMKIERTLISFSQRKADTHAVDAAPNTHRIVR